MNLFLRSLLYLLLVLPATVLAQTNDGFIRRDGTMYVLRNGQPRPMPHDVHLPNGRTVTHDGFVVEAGGQRTELRDGSGCDLTGSTATVATQAGQVVLAPVAVGTGPVFVQAAAGNNLSRWAGWRGKGHYKKRKHKKHGK
ncbi:DUF6799 domain-containing protein [Hymenobacter sediminicola]|uniref:DUF6799 domain-containing protein n=1 Tax=Hymenobacter sediminicola TaxID=2761579 RepID=A0A7G7W8A6_9BACT|nr:DUF6799 domain-containing protein [Hymenobacter sediminicola]QNH62599.1 hypothetical protein H4317_01875 [Hymenobacter sediminicola]